MNEFYAAEPTVFNSATELRLLLGYFGPFSGRYLEACPSDWFSALKSHFANHGDVEMKRVVRLLERAKESGTVQATKDLPWEAKQGWVENISNLLGRSPPRLAGAIASSASNAAGDERWHTLEDFELPPTASERIDGTPEEYVRVCRTLLQQSREVEIIDPFLDQWIGKSGTGNHHHFGLLLITLGYCLCQAWPQT